MAFALIQAASSVHGNTYETDFLHLKYHNLNNSVKQNQFQNKQITKECTACMYYKYDKLPEFEMFY